MAQHLQFGRYAHVFGWLDLPLAVAALRASGVGVSRAARAASRPANPANLGTST